MVRVFILQGLAIVGLLTCAAATAQPPQPPQPPSKNAERDFVELFNGRDLAGWEGAPGWWQVRDGVLVAESTPEKPCERSHYLFWKGGEPRNFDLRMVYRATGAANSGVQFRSERRPEWDIWGYQADLDTAGEYTGCLYQHDRGLVAQRGKSVRIEKSGEKHETPLNDPAELLRQVRLDGWNEYRILAEGPSITLWINGVKMCQVEDDDERFSRKQGVIALQMHQGPPMKIEIKSLRIRILDKLTEATNRK